MNKQWNIYISNILGSFWSRTFADSEIISWIKKVHYIMKDSIWGSAKGTVDHTTIMSNDSIQSFLTAVDIPISECILNRGKIKNMVRHKPILQKSDIKSVSVPSSYLGDFLYIQNSVVSPDSVWVIGSNCEICDPFVVLYVTSENSLKTSTVTINGELIPVYRLYVWLKTDSAKYSDNMGVICGFDLDKYSRDMRINLWSAYVNGVTEEVANTAMSYTVGNDVCAADSTVTGSWSEGSRNYIICGDGRVYSGSGNPRVASGYTVKKGDLLFTGVNVFNSDTLPSPNVVPYIKIDTNDDQIYAINSTIPAIAGEIGTIPDMKNNSWVQGIKALQMNGSISALSYEPEINPLEYILTQLLPGAIRCYTIDGRMNTHSESDVVHKVLDMAYPTAITILNRILETDPIDAHMTIGSGNVALSVCVDPIPLSVSVHKSSHMYI